MSEQPSDARPWAARILARLVAVWDDPANDSTTAVGDAVVSIVHEARDWMQEHSDFSLGDEAVDEIRRLEERVRCFEESLEICLGPQSPLPPLAKDVVRGFFITTAKRRGE